jgi:hypothetical protein
MTGIHISGTLRTLHGEGTGWHFGVINLNPRGAVLTNNYHVEFLRESELNAGLLLDHPK